MRMPWYENETYSISTFTSTTTSPNHTLPSCMESSHNSSAAMESKMTGSRTNNHPKTTTASQSIDGACAGYHGVLHIAQGDKEGAAGTIFFLFVINQLIYADKFNLIPWVHLNNVSHYIYDPKVHSSISENGSTTTSTNASSSTSSTGNLSQTFPISQVVRPSWTRLRYPEDP